MQVFLPAWEAIQNETRYRNHPCLGVMLSTRGRSSGLRLGLIQSGFGGLHVGHIKPYLFPILSLFAPGTPAVKKMALWALWKHLKVTEHNVVSKWYHKARVCINGRWWQQLWKTQFEPGVNKIKLCSGHLCQQHWGFTENSGPRCVKNFWADLKSELKFHCQWSHLLRPRSFSWKTNF